MKTLRFVSIACVGAACGAANAVVIDAFTDDFPAETFITGFGSTISSIGSLTGLQVGNLYLPQAPLHDQIGETPPPATLRLSESSTQFGLASVLGGQRTGTLTSTGAAGPRSEANSLSGYFFNSNGPFAVSSVDLKYGDVNPLNADWYGLRMGKLGFNLIDFDLRATQTITANLTLTSGATSQTKSLTLQALGRYDWNLASFNAIDFHDIDKIELRFVNNVAAADWYIGPVEAVPEPATLAVLGAGAVGLLRRRRR